ncbi:hypothetical protein SALBM217S_05952 [Streptomyces griseoloalbus]
MSQHVDNAGSMLSRTYIADHRTAFLDDLSAWLRIPSVSAQPDHAPDALSADWLVAALKDTGFPAAEVWDTRGAPAVYAEWPSRDPERPDRPRVRPPRTCRSDCEPRCEREAQTPIFCFTCASEGLVSVEPSVQDPVGTVWLPPFARRPPTRSCSTSISVCRPRPLSSWLFSRRQ